MFTSIKALLAAVLLIPLHAHAASNQEALEKIETFLNLSGESTQVYKGRVAHFPRHCCELKIAGKADGILLTLNSPRRTREFVVTESGKTACGQTNVVTAQCSSKDCCGERLHVDARIDECGSCRSKYESISLLRDPKGVLEKVVIKNSGRIVLECLF